MSCGCNDTPLGLVNCNDGCQDCPPSNSISLPPCVSGEACEEITLADCNKYVGAHLPALGVLNSDRLTTILTKLHKKINSLLSVPITVTTYTATNTLTTGIPFVVRYLGLSPIYKSTPGATNSTTTITVGSTTGLVVGMTLEVTTGTGVFTAGTTVATITNATTFTVSLAPTTALTGALNVITATGTDHTIYTTSVVNGTPQTLKAFIGSTVAVSGTGTIV